MEDFQEYLSRQTGRLLAELVEFMRIPSISIDPHHILQVNQAADWIAARLRQLGAQVEVFPTARHPVVYGELLRGGPAVPTILVYGHYDVQPAVPLEPWLSDPFEPQVRGENLYGRGGSDMKGQVMAAVAGAEAALQAGYLPNLKFIIEGEEEIGSVNLGEFLRSQRERLSGAVVFNPDAGGMPHPGQPVITQSLRGGVALQLTVSGPVEDLHSGIYGGAIHNPIHALSSLIAGLHDKTGLVSLPGFYDAVLPVSDEERVELALAGFDDAYFLAQSGAPALWGDPQYTAFERVTLRPTIEVVQFQAGQPKSAIPAQASALFLCRLVPDQDPQHVYHLFKEYLEANAPNSVRWELQYRRGGQAVLIGRDTFGMQKLRESLASAFGTQPLHLRDGGSIHAVVQFREILGIESLLSGFSLMDDHLHGPNEKLHLPTWERGALALALFFASICA